MLFETSTNEGLMGGQGETESSMQNVAEMLKILTEFPKNIMPKTGSYSWDQNKKVKESFERLNSNPDFQAFKKICIEKQIKHPFINSEWIVGKDGKIAIDSSTPLKALFFFAQIFTVMQMNSDFDHYRNMEAPPRESK